MKNALLVVGMMVGITLVSIAQLGIAAPITSEYSPIVFVDEAHVQEVECPPVLMDVACTAKGTSSSKDFFTALGDAGALCDAEYATCGWKQSQEMYLNREQCMIVPGCTLKYQVKYDVCEPGNYLNCTPLPKDDTYNGTTYNCTIEGMIDYTSYRCDTGAPDYAGGEYLA